MRAAGRRKLVEALAILDKCYASLAAAHVSMAIEAIDHKPNVPGHSSDTQ